MEDVRYTGEKTAILVDGAFYRRRAYHLFGDKSPEQRADELVRYCKRHLRQNGCVNDLYRIFYYDAPPINDNVYHPFLKRDVHIGKSDDYQWAVDFFDALSRKRKLAIRLGEVDFGNTAFVLNQKAQRQLFRGDMGFDEIGADDFKLDVRQKGVDMMIGLDIASIAYKSQASQIVLIAGDSDFVPAAKHARREGVDFILDPMWQKIKPALNRHIDGLRTCTDRLPNGAKEFLHVDHINE